jgi:signal transduction histidine kinase
MSMVAIRRAVTTGLAIATLVLAADAVTLSLAAVADGGYEMDPYRMVITTVNQTGWGQLEGLRPGQQVVGITTGDTQDDLVIEAIDAAGHHFFARAASHDEQLRLTLPLCVGALAFAGLAVLFLRGNRAWVPAAANVALLLMSPTFIFHGRPEGLTLVLGTSAAVPAIWLAWRPRVPLVLSLLATLVVAGLVGAWAAPALAPPALLAELQRDREAWTFWSTAGLVILSVLVPVFRGDPIRASRPRVGDIALVGALAGVALAAVTMTAIPPIALAAVLLVALLLLPAWRRTLTERAERVLLADMRERAAIDAAEVERGHLARELHDAPLQQLAAIIRRLELVPGARAETDQLRAVAEELRRMTTELRPPVLDDLGLAAAIEFIAEKDATADVSIPVRIRDDTGLDVASRPPVAVELAFFRIAQEAISNALRHAQASSIEVNGVISPTLVDIEVADDGRGLVESEVRSAARRGRLGMASIRHRAEAIFAEATIGGSESGGTRVHVRWTA